MITQQKIDAFLDKYFAGDDMITKMFRKLIQEPSRHLIPPQPTSDYTFTDDRFMRIAGSLIGFFYRRTYLVDDKMYILRVCVIDDKVVNLSVGAKQGDGDKSVFPPDVDTEYYLFTKPYVNGVAFDCMTEDPDVCTTSFDSAINELIAAGDAYVERRKAEAYATYRDLKNYLEAEHRASSKEIKAK